MSLSALVVMNLLEFEMDELAGFGSYELICVGEEVLVASVRKGVPHLRRGRRRFSPLAFTT